MLFKVLLQAPACRLANCLVKHDSLLLQPLQAPGHHSPVCCHRWHEPRAVFKRCASLLHWTGLLACYHNFAAAYLAV